jgi:CheY-like chemotaxis protein
MARDRIATILVVEDDTCIQDLLEEVLVEAGYRVLRAVDGVNSLHLATVDRPDVILLDMGIPLRSGPEVLDRLRDDPATAHIPVVALSGSPAPPDDSLPRLDGWIEKPFDLDVLIEHVGRLADRPVSTATSVIAANGRG